MAKISESLLSTNILREKTRDSFDLQRVNLLGEDTIFMVNLLETPRVIVFFCYMIDFLRLFQKRSFVLSIEHENQTVATIGTLLHQFLLSCKQKRLARLTKQNFSFETTEGSQSCNKKKAITCSVSSR